MTVKVETNGFDRISRNYFRAFVTSDADLEVIAVSNLADNKTLIHLLKYDSILGHFPEEVSYDDDAIKVGGRGIKAFVGRDPANLPWGEPGVDIVIKSTSFFTNVTEAKAHLDAGVKKALISAPVKNEGIIIITGVDDDKYDPAAHNIISNVPRTTSCLAPTAKALDDSLGIAKDLMTTIHAYTQDQNLQGDPHRDLRRAHTAVLNIMPTTTGAAKAVVLVLLGPKGKLDGYVLYVLTPTGSAINLTFEALYETSVEEINEIVEKAADGRALVYTDESLVSKDIETDSASYTFGSQLTKVIGNQIKVVGRYDNERGYSDYLVDLTTLVSNEL